MIPPPRLSVIYFTSAVPFGIPLWQHYNTHLLDSLEGKKMLTSVSQPLYSQTIFT
jgi:hypothetical protein